MIYTHSSVCVCVCVCVCVSGTYGYSTSLNTLQKRISCCHRSAFFLTLNYIFITNFYYMIGYQ